MNTITLRGTDYPIEWVTDTAFLGMAARLTKDGGVLNTNDPKSAAKVAIVIGDCDYIKSFTYWVKQTCPTIPDELVWHSPDNYGMRLTVQEILTLLGQYQAALEGQNPQEEPKTRMGGTWTEAEYQEVVAAERQAAEHQRKIAQAKEIGELKARLAALEAV